MADYPEGYSSIDWNKLFIGEYDLPFNLIRQTNSLKLNEVFPGVVDAVELLNDRYIVASYSSNNEQILKTYDLNTGKETIIIPEALEKPVYFSRSTKGSILALTDLSVRSYYLYNVATNVGQFATEFSKPPCVKKMQIDEFDNSIYSIEYWRRDPTLIKNCKEIWKLNDFIPEEDELASYYVKNELVYLVLRNSQTYIATKIIILNFKDINNVTKEEIDISDNELILDYFIVDDDKNIFFTRNDYVYIRKKGILVNYHPKEIPGFDININSDSISKYLFFATPDSIYTIFIDSNGDLITHSIEISKILTLSRGELIGFIYYIYHLKKILIMTSLGRLLEYSKM